MEKPLMQLFVKIDVHDTKTGKLIKSYRRKRSRSFLLQFLQHIYVLFNHDYNVETSLATVKEIGGSTGTLPSYAGGYYKQMSSGRGGSTDATKGIVVGTESDAIDNTNFKLIGKIAHGSNPTQLLYGDTIYAAPAVVGANVDMPVVRSFANVSGDTITIEEIGFYVESFSGVFYCIIRDLYEAAVGNGQTATVTYLWRTTA